MQISLKKVIHTIKNAVQIIESSNVLSNSLKNKSLIIQSIVDCDARYAYLKK